MPPLPSVPGQLKVYQTGWVDTLDQNNWGNVLHFGYTGTAPSNSTCAALATEFSVQWAGHMAAECPAPTSLNKVVVTDLTSVTSGEGEWLGAVPGTRGDDSIPANAAVLISYVPSIRYRGGHPRHYLFVGGNADLTGAAEWTSAFTAEALAHWKAYIEAMLGYTTGGTTISSFSSIRYYGKYLPNDGPPHYRLTTPLVQTLDVTVATADQEIASQRSRIGRRRA